MTPERRDDADGVFGRSIDAAVEAVVAADATRDSDTVRSVLRHVTEEGRLCRDGMDATVSDVAKRLATAETRAELARTAYEDAKASAADVEDLTIVRARLDRYETTLDSVESRVMDLGTDLQRVSNPTDDPDAVYESVSELRRIASEADAVQRTADDLQLDLDAFEAWLGSHDHRQRAFEEDVDVVAETLDSVRDACEDPDEETWVDAALRVELVPMLLSDLRSELAVLREMAARDGVGESWTDDLSSRLADLDSRAEATKSALDDAAASPWRNTHGERIDAFARAIEDFEPPIQWGVVQDELERAQTLSEPYPQS